jgi:hypothetical protein
MLDRTHTKFTPLCSAEPNLSAVVISCGNAWERRSQTYFGRGNAVPTLLIVSPFSLNATNTRLSNTLFTSLVGPPLNEFSPLPYVKKWLIDHRAASDNQSKKVANTDTADMRYGHMISVFL